MVVRLQAEVTLASATMGAMGCPKGNLWGASEIGIDMNSLFTPHLDG